MNVALTQNYTLSALHILRGAGFSEEQNRQVFGDCSRLHGHEYRISVTVGGPIDPVTGLLIQRDEIDRLVHEKLLQPFNGGNLSDDFEHTTGEALAVSFYDILVDEISPPARLLALRVRETAKNSFVYMPSGS